MDNISNKAALSVDEAYCYIGVSRAHLYRLMDQGTIPSLHIGRRRLLLKADLNTFLRDRLEDAGYGNN